MSEVNNFETRKETYLKSLVYYNKYIKALEKNKNKKDTVNIIKNPKNDKEIDYALSYFEYLIDTQSTVNDLVKYGCDIDIKNSITVNYISDYLNAIYSKKKTKELKKIIDKYNLNDPKVAALVAYELLVTYTSDKDDFYNAISEKTDFGNKNIIELLVMRRKLQEAFMSLKNSAFNIDSTDNLDIFIKFENEYHNICSEKLLERIKKNNTRTLK